MRLFVAINFPEKVKKVLLNAVGELKKQVESGNFTREENLHLTLAFIGETADVKAARRAIDSLEAKCFEMSVGGYGKFGNIWWIGLEGTPLTELAYKLQSALRSEGFEIEKRIFKPHITLAREVRSDGKISLTVPNTVMSADRISLMKSERINGRLTYTEIYGRNLQ